MVDDSTCYIVIFQESNFISEKDYVLYSGWKGTSFNSFSTCTSSHSKGVSILINSKFHLTLLNKHKSADGRIILLNIEHDKIITLDNIYAPNS